MRNSTQCANMNHGRTNAPVKFCPSCGGSINPQANGRCDLEKHASLRKNRYIFCHDCGKKLAGNKG